MTRISVALVLLSLSLPEIAAAAPKPKAPAAGATACNLKALPLAPGNTWTYKSGAYTVVIKVLDVGPGKDFAGKPVTTVNLEETFGTRVVKSTINCSPGAGMQIGLESFFFSGEPGGPVGSTVTVTDRDKVTFLADEQLVADNGWVEIVKADVARADTGGAAAQHPPAKIEVERHVNVRNEEQVMIGLGSFKPQKIVFELRGRGMVEDQKVEIPIRRPGVVWLVRGVGFVKIDDAFDKTWELTDTNLVAK
jgi:hypothetical protein